MYIRFVAALLLLIPVSGKGQTGRNSALVASTSAFSLGKNEAELTAFSAFAYNLRSFNFANAPYRYYDQNFHSIQSGLQATFGVTQSQWLNAGLDVNQISSMEAGLAGSLVGYGQTGPRIRWRPFRKLPDKLDIAFQNSILITIADRNDFFRNDPMFRNQVIASQFFKIPNRNLNMVVQGTIEANIMPRLPAESIDRRRPVTMPVSLLLGVMPNDDWVIFGTLSHNTEWGTIPWVTTDAYFIRRTATSTSLGVQYLIARKHSVFLSHSFLIDQQFGGGANAVSAGLRLLFLQQY